jgi:hypothetical protein
MESIIYFDRNDIFSCGTKYIMFEDEKWLDSGLHQRISLNCDIEEGSYYYGLINKYNLLNKKKN